MKNIYNLFFATVFVVGIISCKKEDVEIVNVSKAGTEFYYGERVRVWTSTVGDYKNMTYDWTCDGGYFYGSHTQNLFENLWVAPNEPGEYKVTATAKNGNSKSSRSTTMKVKWYYYDEFQTNFTNAGWTTQNSTASLSANADPLLSTVTFRPNNTNVGRIIKYLDHHPLTIPFSFQTTLGWNTYFRAGQAITVSLFFKQPLNNFNNPFLREIRWEIWPTQNPETQNNYRIRYELRTPSTATSVWSAVGNVLPLPSELIDPVQGRNPIFAAAENEEKKLSFSIDANYVFHAYVNGELWFESNSIKDWLTYAKANYSGFEEPIGDRIQFLVPGRQVQSQTPSRVFVNSVYMTNDGSILK